MGVDTAACEGEDKGLLSDPAPSGGDSEGEESGPSRDPPVPVRARALVQRNTPLSQDATDSPNPKAALPKP